MKIGQGCIISPLILNLDFLCSKKIFQDGLNNTHEEIKLNKIIVNDLRYTDKIVLLEGRIKRLFLDQVVSLCDNYDLKRNIKRTTFQINK